MKKKTLEALPLNPRPPRARLEELKELKEKWMHKQLVTAKVHQSIEGPLLAIDVYTEEGLRAREIFAVTGSRTVLLPDGTTSRKGLWKTCNCRSPQWVFSAAARRAIEGFFPLPDRAPKDAEGLVTFLEHARVQDGRMKVKGAGGLGGYKAKELHQPLPENWIEIMKGHTDEWETDILLIKKERYTDPLTGMRKTGIRCICSACGESYLEPQGYYSAGSLDKCDQCGNCVVVVRDQKSKWCYVHKRYSILHFHRHEDTAVAEGYEVEYYITPSGEKRWNATHANVYAWGPFGNYAYNNYYTRCMSGEREYLGQWYAQKMTDNWNCGSVTVVIPPAEGELDDTPLENARIEKYLELAKQYTKYPAPVRMCTLAVRAPVMEAFVDNMDKESVRAATTGRLRLSNGETKPHRALGISKPEYRRYLEEWSWDQLQWYKQAAAEGWKISDEELRSTDAQEFFRGDVRAWPAVARVPLQKLWNYLHRAERRELKRMCRPPAVDTFQHTIQTFKDYHRMAEGLHIPMETEDDRMPYDLFQRHDRLVDENERRRRAAAEALRKQQEAEEARRAEAFTKMWKRVRWADWQDEQLLVRAAKSTAELQEEGRALHHCVGGYTDNVLAGQVIFFIRRAEDPDTPYYTLNVDIKSGRMIQLHGYGNKEQENDKNFPAIKAWAERWVKEIWKPGLAKRNKAKRKEDEENRVRVGCVA